MCIYLGIISQANWKEPLWLTITMDTLSDHDIDHNSDYNWQSEQTLQLIITVTMAITNIWLSTSMITTATTTTNHHSEH